MKFSLSHENNKKFDNSKLKILQSNNHVGLVIMFIYSDSYVKLVQQLADLWLSCKN